MSVDELEDAVARAFIGGSGLGVEILFRETNAETQPLAPENAMVFATGPLTGTRVFCSNRFSVVAKSPLTGIFAEASAGGYWAGSFKGSGYDVLVLKGRAARPVYLYVDEERVAIEDADFIWGKDTIQSTESLRARHGDKARVAVIGVAGENQVNLANIITDGVHGRVLGRCGLGAVMGSKNLKAVVANGSSKAAVADDAALADLMKQIGPQMRTGPDPLRQHGTPVGLDTYNEIGELPIRNWRQGIWTEGAGKITGAQVTKNLLVKRYHCGNCVIGCGRVVNGREGEYAGREIAGPEYEALGMIGANCMIDDLGVIAKANELLNCYGLDCVSSGSAIAFGMEAFERGLIGRDDTDGLELRWGDKEALFAAIRQIGEKRGIGALLGKGVRQAAEQLGGTAKEFAVEVKGLEAPAHDPRAKFTLALGYATSARGACHVSSFTMDFEEGMTIEDLDLPPMPSRFTTANKAQGVAMMQNWMGLFDSVVLCKFSLFGGMTPTVIAKALSAATGWDLDKSELCTTGSRIFNLKRLYNVREGISRKDDTLPPRFLHERKGGGTSELPLLNVMLNEYYRLREWDDFGIPTQGLIRQLDLEPYVVGTGRIDPVRAGMSEG
ncbi:MAG: aldehyde ferredoxin oxidoreductase family protein [Spirochaetales bacterium]|nr:aldehyde ferredoxin oxidoreductase family protein [Spirochaetales bacterium]